jgi:hypothetical protein
LGTAVAAECFNEEFPLCGGGQLLVGQDENILDKVAGYAIAKK